MKTAREGARFRYLGGPGTSDPTYYRLEAAPLWFWIEVAYHLRFYQLIDHEKFRSQYDLDARLPPGATKDDLRAMMREALGERFHLHCHTETRILDAWELTVLAGGTKLKESPPDEASERPVPMHLDKDGFPEILSKAGFAAIVTREDGLMVHRVTAKGQPIAALLGVVAQDSPKMIVDHTGLTGKYDYRLEYSSDLNGLLTSDLGSPRAPDVYRAFREQLGILIAARKLPCEVLVVDSIDRVPTEN